MTHEEATVIAQAAAQQTGIAHEIWEHVGGRVPGNKMILPQGRWVVRSTAVQNGHALQPPPDHVWAKRETIEPTP